jgi:hypothetical protein
VEKVAGGVISGFKGVEGSEKGVERKLKIKK